MKQLSGTEYWKSSLDDFATYCGKTYYVYLPTTREVSKALASQDFNLMMPSNLLKSVLKIYKPR